MYLMYHITWSSPGDELDLDEGDGAGHAEHGQDQQLPVEAEEGRVEEAAAGGHRLHELEDRERGGRLLLEEAAQNWWHLENKMIDDR